MNKFCLLACVAVLLLGAVLADETGSTGEREKRQYIAPDGMVMVPVPVDAFYGTEEMFANVPASAVTPANSRSVDALTASNEETSGSSPIAVRQYYRPYGGYRPYGPPSYLPFRPRPYNPYGSYNPYRPYGVGATFG